MHESRPFVSVPHHRRFRILLLSLAIVSVVSWLPLADQPSAQAAGDCTVNAADTAIEADEITLLNGINAYRQQNGAGPLQISTALNKASAWMSRDMATNDYFSHYDLFGRSPGTRMTDCGFDNIYTWRGENLAAGQWTPEAALEAWKGSAGHNALMLDPKYVVAGIGKAYDSTSPYKTYWTLDVASALDSSGVIPTSGSSSTATPVPPTATRQPTSTSAALSPTPTRTSAPTRTAVPPTNTPPPTSTSVPPTRTATLVPTSAALAPSGGERLLNPGFESGLTSWDRPSWFASVADVQTSTVHAGGEGFRFQGKSSGPYVQQSAPASGGQTVNFSGWVNVPTRGNGMSGQIELLALSASNGTLGTYKVYSFSSTTPGWVQVSKSQTLPAGTASVRVRVRFTTLDGTVYVDDLSLR